VKTWSTPVRTGNSGTISCALCGGLKFKPALKCEGFGFVRCTSCGLVQMNPQPVKEEIIARYSSVFGKDYLSYEIENEASFLKLQQLALNDAGFDKLEKEFFLCTEKKSAEKQSAEKQQGEAEEPPSVLDIGCATGTLLAFLRGRGWRVTGVEISPSAQYAQKERALDVRSRPLEECAFADNSFDVVLASHLIEHLNAPAPFLAEVRRVLKNNGRVFLTTPNISGFQARLFGGRWRSAIFDHLYLYSARTLKKMLKNAGFFS